MNPLLSPSPEIQVIVHSNHAVAEGVTELSLQHVQGAPLPDWEPGAHVDLILPGGIVRQYSLCGDPADRTTMTLSVLRQPASSGGSVYVHHRLQSGDRVSIRGPRNHFRLVDAERYLFIAGGIGITPLIPMIAEVSKGKREWHLAYAGRSRRSMPYQDALRHRHGDRVEILPRDEAGLLDLDRLLDGTADGTAVYCCGPERLLHSVEERCRTRPALDLHIERFTPRNAAPAGPVQSFEVELSQTQLTLLVPADQSILEVLESAGVSVLSSCRKGTCGSCEVPVLAGAVDHRDELLADDERASNNTMMICVSRAADSTLLLDL